MGLILAFKSELSQNAEILNFSTQKLSISLFNAFAKENNRVFFPFSSRREAIVFAKVSFPDLANPAIPIIFIHSK